MKTFIKYTLSFFFLVSIASCEDLLDEEIFSQITTTSITPEVAEGILNGVYQLSQSQGDESQRLMLANELTTDLMFNEGGGLENLNRPYQDFTWAPTDFYLIQLIYQHQFSIVAQANQALEFIPQSPLDQGDKDLFESEARFLRALAFQNMEDLYGPVPLDTVFLASEAALSTRPSQMEMEKFIREEYRNAATVLPIEARTYGRATKGAALAMLMRFELNKKNWQTVVDLSKEIMDLGAYSIFQSDNRADLFKIENEVNSEFIWARNYIAATEIGMIYLPRSAPRDPNYQYLFPPKANFATNYKIYSDFYNSFEPNDQRRESLLTEYLAVTGETVQLGEDNIRPFKYQEDPDGFDRWAGNDMPIIRYADVLLSRAEALNELNGPTQESIDLINQVREAAGLEGISLANFSSTDSLRDHILDERGWEFWNEEIRRQDLIRHGKFISGAIERGLPAQPFQVKFPIPQTEIDANPNLTQNDGY